MYHTNYFIKVNKNPTNRTRKTLLIPVTEVTEINRDIWYKYMKKNFKPLGEFS